ncbi:response regulator [Streptomyces sp. NPDC056883]|uniref:response regulator n=1 Tax=Streptomyces sp. NPDC056883 TaxID=3345959 RepID=UPI00368DD0C3
MSQAFWTELVSVVPGILWVAFATFAFLALREPIIQRFPQVRTFRGFGIEVELAEELLDRASDQGSAAPSPEARKGVVRRLDHAAEFLLGGRILWVDDHPEGNSALIKLFRTVGMTVDTARSTEEALAQLRQGNYDIILSDIERNGDPQAGIKMLRELERHRIQAPVLIHAMRFNPELGVDRRIFAGTNKANDVVHYVIDLMERARMTLPFWAATTEGRKR